MKKINYWVSMLSVFIYPLMVGMVDPTAPPNYAAAGASLQMTNDEERLQGIFFRDMGAFAVIDNILVKQNDILLDGAKVISIDKEFVTLYKPNANNVILHLPSSVRRDEN